MVKNSKYNKMIHSQTYALLRHGIIAIKHSMAINFNYHNQQYTIVTYEKSFKGGR